MKFLVLRLLTHSELGMFHEYRRRGLEKSRQRAVNFDGNVVDRVFPAAKDEDRINMDLRFETDRGIEVLSHSLRRQEKNWRLEGNCPVDKCYGFVAPGCLFAMQVDAGNAPATGSWAVFPARHPVTVAILSDGESRGLTKSAMVALAEHEATQALNVLSKAKPNLFGGMTMRPKVERTAEKNIAGKRLAPNPARLVQILGSVGHTLPSAIADLVDNSITADATRVDIKFGRPDGGHGRWLTVADNGRGMDESTLEEAMRIGSGTEYQDNALGKYGFGLKGASWSQTKEFTVVTKRARGKAHHLTWDTADMENWIAKSDALAPWEIAATNIAARGTVVLWKNMRPPQHMPAVRGLDPHSAEVMQLERHLALVFHRFIEGKAAGRKAVTITVNGTPVKANNPVGHPLTAAYDQKTIKIPTESGDGKVQVQAYLLPSEDEISEHHKANGPEAVRDALAAIGLYGKRNETQGLFIYRHDRLIRWGGWHQMWETNDEKTKLARVVVNFDKNLDEALKINISKQIVHLPQQLQAEVKKLADQARRDSQKKYRKGATAPEKPRRPGITPLLPVAPGGAPALVPNPAPIGTDPGGMTSPKISVSARMVSTKKFVWKVAVGITGGQDLQVSSASEDLAALVTRIAEDPTATHHLVAFLEYLDKAKVQEILMAREAR